ncbi:MAG: putative permease [Sedimentibacter sp.]|nr:putative permease [Sedimentibacter sp.]
MAIPVYVVTGFLESGKTTFLNNFLNNNEEKNKKILVIQFEGGEENFSSNYNNCSVLYFPIKTFEQDIEKIVKEIHHHLTHNPFNEVWIEWNGIIPFSQLQSLLLQPLLIRYCKIEKVIHITNVSTIKNLLGKTGSALPEQISNSDFAVIHNGSQKKEYNQVRQILQSINPGMGFYKMKSHTKLFEQIYVKKKDPIGTFIIQILVFILLYLIIEPILEQMHFPISKVIIIFIGIILQAIPFLLIGVLLSSAIQVFITKDFIERRFPKSLGVGMIIALLLGFCLPVCDCASIPIFRSLVKKGIPIPVAVTFMTATPVINPVVMLSTYYAFGENWEVVITRVCLGITSAILIGLLFGIWRSKGNVFIGGYDNIMCSCGCYENNEANSTAKVKINLFIRHSQMEFFSVGKYLIIGTMISAIIQTFGLNKLTVQSETGYTISIIIMMFLAFVLSLCSSSDAVIARSFANQIPLGAIMGFLVFGPMIDIKNVLMLSSGFSKKFIGKLLFIAFIVCFSLVFLYAKFILGGM